jgi:hypothetical protein
LWRSEGGPWLPLLKLEVDVGGVEAEILRRAKTRAVGGCSLGGPAVRE